MKNLEGPLNPRMRSDNELLRIKMKRSSIQGLKETLMKKNQIASSTGEPGCQKKTCPKWIANSIT